MSKLPAALTFLKAGLQNPMQVSTIFQTSTWLCEKLLTDVSLKSGQNICELGPGAGAITQFIFQNKSPDCHYVGIELNKSMHQFLVKKYPRLNFIEGSAEFCAKLAQENGAFDSIISSLPWTIFDLDLQQRILTAISQALKPGGVFVTYVCLNAELYPNAKHFKSLLNEKFAHIEKSKVVWRNIPPAYVLAARSINKCGA